MRNISGKEFVGMHGGEKITIGYYSENQMVEKVM